MKFDQNLFGLRVQEARISLGMTQEEFAEKIDISVSYYQKIERGTRACSFEFLIAIAEHLHVSTDYLLTGKKSREDELREAILTSSQLLRDLAYSV